MEGIVCDCLNPIFILVPNDPVLGVCTVDLHHVCLVNRHCNMAKSLPAKPTEFLRGLTVVI